MLLGYGEPLILEVFKKTVPTKLCWVLFPIEDIKQAVDSKENKNKRKDRQVAGQSSSTPFMSMKDSYSNNKMFTFGTQNGLEERINRLTMMISNFTTKEQGLNNQFKPKIYQNKRRGQNRNIYDRQ